MTNILPYHAKPFVSWRDDESKSHSLKVNPNQTLFGFELEVEDRTNSIRKGRLASRITQHNDDVVCKQESSLCNGFEIVSHPATIGYYRQHFDWSFMDLVRHSGFNIHEIGEQGLHIHMNRSSFDNDDHVVQFANTVTSDHISLSSIGVGQMFVKPTVWCATEFVADVNDYTSRYKTVNVRGNTVEIRAFIPTLSKYAILWYMDYLTTTQKETGEQK
jgi:hypothetical protein